MTTHIKSITDLKPGDVLLCHKNIQSDFVAQKIKEASGSDYCHAAIYYDTKQVAESKALDGWKKGKIVSTEITSLITRYEHIAILRQPDAWCHPASVQALKLFITKVLENEAKYNFEGAYKLKSRKELHQENVHEKLSEFFKGNMQPHPPQKAKYFCSEFVVDCFIATRFIEPSAAILYQSDTYYPGDLGKDATFGTFFGYLAKDDSYKVSKSDDYYNTTPFEKIFGYE